MKNFSFLFFAILLSIPYFPRLDSIDIIGTQWLVLSIFLLIFLPMFLFHKVQLFDHLKNLFSSIPIKIFLIFLIFVFISILFSKNINLSLVDFSRILITSTTILFSTYYIKFIKIDVLLSLVSFSLVLDVFYLVLFPLYFVSSEGYSILELPSIFNSSFLTGYAGNKNIMATILAIKFPSFLYLYFSSKRYILYIPVFILFFAIIFLIKARAVYLSLFIITLFSLLFYFRFYYKKSFYLIISLFFSYFLHLTFLGQSISNNDFLTEASSIKLSAESSSHRFLLWDNALNYILNNPFIGCGIGNWKIESAPYWKTHLSDFIVPYHAHNDFLELSTETGIIGGMVYFFLFIYILYNSFKHSLNFSKFYFIIFSFFIIYFIDSFLNFPIERTVMQIYFALFFAFYISISSKPDHVK